VCGLHICGDRLSADRVTGRFVSEVPGGVFGEAAEARADLNSKFDMSRKLESPGYAT
jgi:hypothetical protein